MKKKSWKKIINLALALTLLMSSTLTSQAAENVYEDQREYIVVNGEEVVYVGEDYENKDTGEYVKWDNTRGVDKTFSFKIRYSVTSSSFTVNSTKVLVKASAKVVNSSGTTQSGFTGHLYTVSVVGVSTRNLQFSVGSTQSGTITGLTKGGTYKVKITNNDYLSSSNYLSGSGTVSTL